MQSHWLTALEPGWPKYFACERAKEKVATCSGPYQPDQDEITETKGLRTGQRASATKLATKVKEILADPSFRDDNYLKQCKLSLNEKIECLRKWWTKRKANWSVQVNLNPRTQIYKREIEEHDDRRADQLQKIVFDIDYDRLNAVLQPPLDTMSQTQNRE